MYRSFIHEDSKIRLSLCVAPGHRTVQEGLRMVSCRESITKSKHVLYRIFALEGFVKACPVGLTDSYLVVSNIKHAWTLLYFLYMTPYSVLPARCGAQESQRALFVCLSVCLSLSLSLSVSVSVCVCLSVSVSVSDCLCVCL